MEKEPAMHERKMALKQSFVKLIMSVG